MKRKLLLITLAIFATLSMMSCEENDSRYESNGSIKPYNKQQTSNQPQYRYKDYEGYLTATKMVGDCLVLYIDGEEIALWGSGGVKTLQLGIGEYYHISVKDRIDDDYDVYWLQSYNLVKD